MSTPTLEPRCLCGRPLPVRRPPATAATTCSYWCGLVKRGTFTLAQVGPMLQRERGPVPTEPEQADLFGAAS